MFAKRLMAFAILAFPTGLAFGFVACISDSNVTDGGADATADATVDQKTDVATGDASDATADVNPYPFPCMVATLEDAGDAGVLVFDGGQAAALQGFSGHMYGCSGSVTYPNRAALCNAVEGCTVCSAAEWMAKFQNVAPTHQYWVEDSLGFAGNGPPNDCFAGALADGGILHACSPTTDPMRVCIDGPVYDGGFNDAAIYPYASIDNEGNVCNWTACGFIADAGAGLDAAPDAQTSNLHFGGCYDDTTAGSLCCCP